MEQSPQTKKLEIVTNNPREFIGASDAELGTDRDLLTSRYREWQDKENGQRLGLFIVEPKRELSGGAPETTVIMPAQHDYRIDPLWQERARILASKLDARIICAETPGVVGLLEEDGADGVPYETLEPLDGQKQTKEQRVGALTGDFTPLAKTQVEAISDILHEDGDSLEAAGRVVLLGQSMGAAMSVDMIKELQKRGVNLTDVIAFEMVNTHKSRVNPVGMLQIAKNLGGIEAARRDTMIAENEIIGRGDMTAFERISERTAAIDKYRKGQQAMSVAGGAIALMNSDVGSLIKTLDSYGKSKRPNIQLVRGRESTVAKQDDYNRLENALQSIGANVQQFTIIGDEAMGHHVSDSLVRQHGIATDIKKNILD